MKRSWFFLLILLPAVVQAVAAQQPKTEEKKNAAPQISPLVRLAAAKTAFLKRAGSGGNIPYDVISEILENWGHFTLVNDPEKADVIIEIFSTQDNDIAAATTVRTSPQTGRSERSASVGKQYAAPEIRLTVYDTKTNFPLWRAIEHPKYALKKKDIENHEVEAAQRLATRLHDQLEPPEKQ
ncbi:MAG TPA: hypothetical protein VJA94_14675 [Candidatus Angelobacter sp.]